jgi:hypothetical protein
MSRKRAEDLLHRITEKLAADRVRVRDQRKLLAKATNRKTANVIQRDLTILGAKIEGLKVQRKALKRGIIPDDLSE